jgi:hypothetical protein
MREYKVYVTETVVRPVWVAAETPAEAERIAEEPYHGQQGERAQYVYLH